MIFRLVGLFALVGVILSIVGSTESSNLTSGLVNAKTQAGLALYIAAWVGTCGLFTLVARRYESIEDGEHRLLLAVGIALPLILVRLIYSCIYTFGHVKQFNMLTGNVTIQLVMAVLEEIVVVLVCLGIGLTLQVRPNAEYSHQPSVSTRQGDSFELESGMPQEQAPKQRQYQRPKRRGGPISRLVMFAVDEINERRH
jgi:uncharacterized membrane protein